MVDGDKRCGCGRGCATFGACLRAKGLQIQYPSIHDAVQGWDTRLSDFRKAAENGCPPKNTTRRAVDKALNTLRNTKD